MIILIILLFLWFPTESFGQVISGSTMQGTALGLNIWFDVVGKWKLSNTTWTDSSSNSNNLTAEGTVTATAGHNGGSNLGASFAPSTTNYLYINDNSSLSPTGNVTMATWVYPLETVLGTTAVMNKHGSYGDYSYDLNIDNSGKVACRLSSNGTALTSATGATTVSEQWNHIACVYNGTNISVYLNGVLDSNGIYNPASYTSGIYDGTNDFRIGYGGTGRNLYLDDAVMFSRALSVSEINALYNMGDDFDE